MSNAVKLIAGAAIAGVIAVGAFFTLSSGSEDTAVSTLPTFPSDMQVATSASGHGLPDLFIGDADAPIEIIEYASFTCPHCATFHKTTYPELKEAFIDTGKVKFILREVYFDKYGLWAGMMARCGGDLKYFGIVDLLFKKQDEWARGSQDEIVEGMYSIGRQAGLTDDGISACLQDQEQAEALVADYQLKAGEDGISATPSFVIDGELMSNMTFAEFEKLLNDKLN